MFTLSLIGIYTLALAALGVYSLRHWATARNLLALPNERSSHVRPTPSGGGVAIVLCTLLGLIFYTLASDTFSPVLWVYAGSAAAIALVSWFDDLYTLPNRWRFAVHSAAALVVIIAIGSWQTVDLPLLGTLALGWLGLPLTFVWIVGLTNAYNFMDGIDGLAGSQAVLAGTGWALVGWWSDQPAVMAVGLLIAVSSLGFLAHNWAPAKIFMGDVGSAFLGFSFAVLPLIVAQQRPRLALVGLLLVWPFVFDAGFTVLRRLRHGENIFTAHRSHLYQRLVIAGHSHRTVTLLYTGLAVTGLLLALGWYGLSRGNVLATLLLLPLLALGLWLLVINQEQQARVKKPSPLAAAFKAMAESDVAAPSNISSLQR